MSVKNQLTMDNIDEGRILEMVNNAIVEIAQDISARPLITKARSFTLQVAFDPGDKFVGVAYQLKTNLPPQPARKAAVFTDSKGNLVTRVTADDHMQPQPLPVAEAKESGPKAPAPVKAADKKKAA